MATWSMKTSEAQIAHFGWTILSLVSGYFLELVQCHPGKGKTRNERDGSKIMSMNCAHKCGIGLHGELGSKQMALVLTTREHGNSWTSANRIGVGPAMTTFRRVAEAPGLHCRFPITTVLNCSRPARLSKTHSDLDRIAVRLLRYSWIYPILTAISRGPAGNFLPVLNIVESCGSLPHEFPSVIVKQFKQFAFDLPGMGSDKYASDLPIQNVH